MDRRIARTERSIQEAFLAQRAEKPLEKIRVRELCEAAQIHKIHLLRPLSRRVRSGGRHGEPAGGGDSGPGGAHPGRGSAQPPRVADPGAVPAFVAHDRQVKILFSGSRQGALVDRMERRLREMTSREDPGYWDDPVRRVVLSFCVRGCYYAFYNNSGRLQEDDLVEILGSVARAAQNIGALHLSIPGERKDTMIPTASRQKRSWPRPRSGTMR